MLSELSTPRPIISRKRNQRKLRTRTQKFQHLRHEKQSEYSLDSVKESDISFPLQDRKIEICSLNLNFQDERRMEDRQEIGSARFRTLKIELENDSLRAENEDLKQQLKELRQQLDVKQSEEGKQSELSISTIIQDPSTPEYENFQLLEADLLKQICEELKKENYFLRKQLDLRQFTNVMLKKKIEFKPRLNMVKYAREIDPYKNCPKCKHFKQMKVRNKTLNDLVLSLSDRLNNFAREGGADEIFQLSPN